MNRKIFIIFAAILAALQININAEKGTKGTGELNLDTNPLPKYQTIPKQKLVDNQRLNNYMVEMYKRKQQGIYDYKGSRSGGDVKTLTQKVQEIVENKENIISQANSLNKGSSAGQPIKGMMAIPFASSSNVRCRSGYGSRRFKNSKGKWVTDFHYGIDIITAGPDLTVTAAAAGTVIAAAYNHVNAQGSTGMASYGNYVTIDHGNGVITRYAHMQINPVVKVGDKVNSGDPLGKMGNTGNSYGAHLHFEVRPNNNHTNPIPWLPGNISGGCK